MKTIRISAIAVTPGGKRPEDVELWWVQIPLSDACVADEQRLAEVFPRLIERGAAAMTRAGIPLCYTQWEAVDYGPLDPKESHR